jgi:hypothetical protein
MTKNLAYLFLIIHNRDIVQSINLLAHIKWSQQIYCPTYSLSIYNYTTYDTTYDL